MAKTGTKTGADDNAASASNNSAAAPEKGESTAAYWKRILLERPRLLNSRKSNEALREIWLKDHPGQDEVPANIMANLANVKTQLRNKKGNGKRAATVEVEEAPARQTAHSPAHQRGLKALEDRIDDCLMLAREMNQPQLENVIDRLRRARNEVVVQIGE
ncbi:MAG: hypothetical protein JNM56_21480 [Planctomycetia bacterium]|nr:hypothetical protein [Planctomycetia bacterium]